MFRQRPFFVLLLLPIALIGLNLFTSKTLGQNRKIERVVYSPPSLSLTANPTIITACKDEATRPSIVNLDARATSPSGNPIRYNWRANAGRIEGKGPIVTWDLAGLKPGYYKAFVEIDTGSGDEECQAFASTSVLVRCAPPPPAVCPNVSVVCPEAIAMDQPITFTANLVGGSGNVAPNYSWIVSAGTIVEGQGTTSITVDTKGLAGQTVKATFSMAGYPQVCSATCGVQIPIPKSTCRKFDEFPNIPRNDEKARLDNFAIELQNDPTSTAYLVVYPGASGRPGDLQTHISRLVDYLVNSRGFDARRIVTITGQARPQLMVELWICPQGASFSATP